MLRLAGSSPASRKTKICESSSVVELHLAKVDVAGSSPVFRSLISPYIKSRLSLFDKSLHCKDFLFFFILI